MKVGRTTNVIRRIQQWVSKCPRTNYLLRGYWPDGLQEDKVLIMGQTNFGVPGPSVKLLERLILLELTDMATNPPWLDEKPQPLEKIFCPSCRSPWYLKLALVVNLI